MKTKKLTEVPQAGLCKEANLIAEIDEELKRVPSSQFRKLVEDERARAEAAEGAIADNLAAETSRAAEAEKANAGRIAAEAERAAGKEGELQEGIQAEAARAAAAETSLQAGIDAHTEAVSRQVQSLQQADAALEEKKANASDVSRELGNRYTKDQVYTKAEVLAKIGDLIGSAPETLDTFREIAEALGNDPNFAATIMAALGGKADKEDGKGLSSNDYTDAEKEALADVAGKKHTHGNKAALDGLTDLMLANWTEAYSKRHGHGNKPVLDKVTQALLDNWTAAHTHISDTVGHVTAAERTKWNAVTDKVDKAAGKQLSTNDYTTADKDKLAGIAPGAEVNVQPDWGATDKGSDAFIKNKPSSFPPSAHSHTKSQITDMPTMLSQFTNDPGYITQSDVDTSQDHTHNNKGILDKLTQTMIDKLAGIAEGANKYVHPTAAGSRHVPSGGASGQILRWGADGTAVWGADSNTTYGSMKGATASEAGTQGLVPVPAAGKQGQFLRGDGTWAAPPDTVYTHPSSGATAGTYRSVAVNAQGHVTAGTNPTTLSGYGITDAAAKNHGHDGAYVKSTYRTLALKAAGWSSAYPYTQSVNASGITAGDDIKIIGLHIPAGATADQVKAWNKAAGCLISSLDGVKDGAITFRAYKKPAVDFQIITEGG